MSRRILVTGCARSSTGYFAALLTRLGIPCGHEVLFGPRTATSATVWPATVRAESSWLAAPFASALPGDVVVVHVVRDPEPVLRSLWRIGLFRTRSIYRRHAEQHCASLREGTPMQRTARYWIHWNQLTERACERGSYLRLHVETLDEDGVARIATLAQIDLMGADIRAALADVPRTTNTAGDKSRDAAVDWSEVQASPLAAELAESARRYACRLPTWTSSRRSGAA